MDIKIKKIEIPMHNVNEHLTNITGAYSVLDNDREFTIVCRFNSFSSSLSLANEQGTLHIDKEADRVTRQLVALSGACGLNVTDEPVEGLSTIALRLVIIAEKNKGIGEIILKRIYTEQGHSKTIFLIDGKAADINKFLNPDFLLEL